MTRSYYRWIRGRRRHAAATKRRARAGCRYRQLGLEPVEDRVLLSTIVGPHPWPAVWNVDVGPAIWRWGAESAIEQVDVDPTAVSIHQAAFPAQPVAEVAEGGLRFGAMLARSVPEPATGRFDSEAAGVRPLAQPVDYQAPVQTPIDRSSLDLVPRPLDAERTAPGLPAGLADLLPDGGSSVALFAREWIGDRLDAQTSSERPSVLVVGTPPNGELPADGPEIWVAFEHFSGRITDGQSAPSPPDAGVPGQFAVGGFATDVTEPGVDSPIIEGRILADLTSLPLESTSSVGRSDTGLSTIDLHRMDDSQETHSATTAFAVETAGPLADLGSAATQVPVNEGGLIDIGTSLSNEYLLMSIDAVGGNSLTDFPEVESLAKDLDGSDVKPITRGEAALDAGSVNTPPSTSRITPRDDGLAAVPGAERSERMEETDEEASSSDSEEGGARESHLTAIAPADLASEESEGGLIDLTGVVNEPVRLAGETAVESGDSAQGLVHGEQPDQAAAEELAVVGARGRSQVFELAMATGRADGAREVQPRVDRTAPIGNPAAIRPFVALPDPASGDHVSSPEGASPQSDAHETVFAEMAEEDADVLTSAANEENHWSASLIPLLGPAVISLGIAERTAHARRQKRRASIGFPS